VTDSVDPAPETGLLGSAAAHATTRVPVRSGSRLAGLVTMERLLAAAPDAAVAEVMDADPPTVGPGNRPGAGRVAGGAARAVRRVLGGQPGGHGPAVDHQPVRQGPAFGAGPLATVVQDLLSILIYFAVTAAIVTG